MPTSILDLLKKGDKSGVQNEFDKGVDINAKYRFGASILNSYVDGLAKVDIVRFLLESGADVNTVDRLGNSPLITAIKKLNVQIDIVRLLVEMGANVNHVDNTYKKSALHWACTNGKEDIAIYIIKSGADITLKDKDGKTALDLAKVNRNKKLIDYLEMMDDDKKENKTTIDDKSPMKRRQSQRKSVIVDVKSEKRKSILDSKIDRNSLYEAEVDRKSNLEAVSERQRIIEAEAERKRVLEAEEERKRALETVERQNNLEVPSTNSPIDQRERLYSSNQSEIAALKSIIQQKESELKKSSHKAENLQKQLNDLYEYHGMDDNGSIKNSPMKNSGKDEKREIVPESYPNDSKSDLRTNLLEDTIENSSTISAEKEKQRGKCCSIM